MTPTHRPTPLSSSSRIANYGSAPAPAELAGLDAACPAHVATEKRSLRGLGARIAVVCSLVSLACGQSVKKGDATSATPRDASSAQVTSSAAEPVGAVEGDSNRPSKGGADALDKVVDGKNRASNGGSGRFVYQFEKATQGAYASVEPLFQDARLPGVIEAMKTFALPRDVPVVPADVGQCASPNAFYMSGKHAVFLCYPMAKAAYENFVEMGKSPQEASNLTRDAMTFILLHELGHALIGELNLGVTGKEEDAVDELAALILIQNGKHDMAIAGTYSLVLLNHFQGKGHKTPYFDEHSISEARLYDILCMIIGSNPEKYGPEVLEKHPELRARAPKCPATYEKIDRAWTTMLAPHMRAASR